MGGEDKCHPRRNIALKYRNEYSQINPFGMDLNAKLREGFVGLKIETLFKTKFNKTSK